MIIQVAHTARSATVTVEFKLVGTAFGREIAVAHSWACPAVPEDKARLQEWCEHNIARLLEGKAVQRLRSLFHITSLATLSPKASITRISTAVPSANFVDRESYIRPLACRAHLEPRQSLPLPALRIRGLLRRHRRRSPSSASSASCLPFSPSPASRRRGPSSWASVTRRMTT